MWTSTAHWFTRMTCPSHRSRRSCTHTRLREPPGKPLDDSGTRPFFQSCTDAHDSSFVTQQMLAISTLARTFEAFGIELDPREVIAPQFHHWHEPPMFPDTPRFLEVAESLGLPVYVVSNIDRSCIDAAMTYHGLAFDAVITSEDVRSYKPRPAVFKAALDRIGLPASEVLHIGDSQRRRRGSCRGHCRCVGEPHR